MKSLLRGLALSLASVLVTMLLIELGLRLFPRLMPPGLRLMNRAFEAEVSWSNNMVADRYLGYHMRANLDVSEEYEGRTVRSHLVPLDHQEIGVRDMGLPAETPDAIA